MGGAGSPVGDVQEADAGLGMAAPEAVADVGVELEHLISIETGQVTLKVLPGVNGIGLGEEAAGEIVVSGEGELLE